MVSYIVHRIAVCIKIKSNYSVSVWVSGNAIELIGFRIIYSPRMEIKHGHITIIQCKFQIGEKSTEKAYFPRGKSQMLKS